ncbi:hypothetical protein SAMN05216436_10511 [bacterium A37T11]|nr:hypothetical protein SAMN05216436_10511 [bacterium A37T11]
MASIKILRQIRKSIYKPSLAAILVCSLFITFYGCGKPSDNPMPDVDNPSGCAIASDVDQTVGLRNFEYNDKGLLTKMTAPNYYYGTYVRTITPSKVTETFPGYDTYYTYSGGSGNIYDGDPKVLHQMLLRDTALYQYFYDDKKRLSYIYIPTIANGYLPNSFMIVYRTELKFTYDANDNVTQIRLVKDYWEKVVVYPSNEFRYDYLQIGDQYLDITYDDKPSPYTAISKYWAFIGSDFLHYKIYSLNMVRFWANVCSILSKNNPQKITGKLRYDTYDPVQAPLNTINASFTYKYNANNLPVSMALDGQEINSFTYNCK